MKKTAGQAPGQGNPARSLGSRSPTPAPSSLRSDGQRPEMSLTPYMALQRLLSPDQVTPVTKQRAESGEEARGTGEDMKPGGERGWVGSGDGQLRRQIL